MRFPRILVPVVVVFFGACSDDDPDTYDNYSPVELDAQIPDAGPDAASEGGPDAGQDATPPPPELAFRECNAPNLPAAANRIDALRGLTVSPSRVYIATAEGVRAYQREADGCPGASIDTFGSAGLLQGDFSALGSVGELLIVSGAAGTRVVDDSGSDQSSCDANSYESLSFDATGIGFGSRGFPSLTRFLVTAGSCDVSVAAVPSPVFAALAAAPHHQSHEPVVAMQREPSTAPVVVRTDQVAEDVSGLCSASHLVDASLGCAVLDPACGALRVFSLENGFERFRATFPGGEVLRAMAPIPGSLPEQLLAGSVTSPTQPLKLRIVDLQAP